MNHKGKHFSPPFVLAIDVGTTTVVASMFDSEASLVAGTLCSQRNRQDIATDGTNEEPAERIFQATEAAIDGTLRKAGAAAKEIAAVGLDSMAGSFVGLARNGTPVTSVYTYADTRPWREVDLLKNVIDPEDSHQRTGTILHTSYLPPRILWLRRRFPELFGEVAKWSDVCTMLYSRWFGVADAPCSISIASWSGMLNRRKLEWDEGLLQATGIESHSLPALSSYATPMQGLSKEFALRWPALASKPFFLGIGDGAAANVAAGCVDPSSVALTVGTTSAMRLFVEQEAPPVPDGLWAYKLGSELSLVGGAFTEGGNVVSWAKNVLRLPPDELLDAELQKLSTGGHGLSVLPFLGGERSLGWSAQATGVISGLRLSSEPIQILQAAMEAVACRFSLVAKLLPDFEGERRIVAGGGALASSRWWTQTMANALNAPVYCSDQAKETVRGAAILALKASGTWRTLKDVPIRFSELFHPDPVAAEIYNEAVKRQAKLYAKSFQLI